MNLWRPELFGSPKYLYRDTKMDQNQSLLSGYIPIMLKVKPARLSKSSLVHCPIMSTFKTCLSLSSYVGVIIYLAVFSNCLLQKCRISILHEIEMLPPFLSEPQWMECRMAFSLAFPLFHALLHRFIIEITIREETIPLWFRLMFIPL